MLFYSTDPRREKLAKDKRSSLLRTFVNYGRKKFYNIRPRMKKFAEIKVLFLYFSVKM
jgi:hypothetical protein